MDINGYEIPQFMTEINSLPPDPQPEYTPSFDAWQLDYFYKMINNFSAMNDHDMHNFVRSNIDFIAKQFIDGTCKYAKKLGDMDFLRVLKDILSTMPITESRRLFVNKLCYSYLYYRAATHEVLHEMLEISKIVNSRTIGNLLTIEGLPEENAVYLAMCRYSSTDEYQNAVRVNFYICTCSDKIMTEQTIIYIYEKLFDQMRYLFMATMFDYDPKQHGIASDNAFDEQDIHDVFSNITLAVLTLTNNMTSGDIYRLIKIFLDAWSNTRPPVRFSLRALSRDFGRIRDVVDRMYDQNNIYIP